MKSKYTIYCFFFIFFTFSSVFVQNNLNSQNSTTNDEKLPVNIYLVGAANYIKHTTQIPLIYNSLDCGNYLNGTSSSYYIALGAGYDIFGKLLTFDSRIYLEAIPIELTANTDKFEVYDSQKDEYVKLQLQHYYKANINYLGFDFGLTSQPLDFLPIFIRIGYDFASPMGSATFTNSQTIQSPNGILFPNQRRTQILEEGELTNLNTSNGLNFALQTRFNWLSNLQIGAEISYRKGLNSLLNNADWNTDIYRFGVIVNLDNGVEKDTTNNQNLTNNTTDTIPIETPKPQKPITPIKSENLSELRAENVSILETFVTQTYPILPYIFFDSASANLRKVYDKKYENSYQFDEKTLPQDNLEIYYYILDILGSRMTKNTAKLTITGLADINEFNTEAERENLGKQRAEIIAKYLINKWGIDKNRLIIDTKDKSKINSNNRDIAIENRRIELNSTDEKLFEPIIHSRFIEYTSNKKEQNVTFKSKNDLNNIKLFVKSDNQINEVDKSFYKLNKSGNNYNLTLNNSQNYLKTYSNIKDLYQEKELLVITEDKYNQIDTINTGFTVFKDKNNFELGRLNLIVFDFNSSEISTINKNMLKNFTRYAIKEDSKTKIIGSTDLVGELNYNFKLSQDRADAVADLLRGYLPAYRYDEVKGIGPTDIKYDNSIPEGRFYCRTVLIEVKTPIKVE